MKAALLVLALALAGCSTLGANNMSAEQLTAAAKDKNASAVCATGTGPWGKVTSVFVNVDKASINSGQITVDSECKITVSTAKAAP